MGKGKKGLNLLNEAGKLVEVWNGIYSKLIMGLLLAGNEQDAIRTILKAINENPEWKENLPCFYFLRNRHELRKFYIKRKFTEKDWNQAIQFLIGIDRPEQALKLGSMVIKKYPRSSYTYYLRGEAYKELDETRSAVADYKMVIELDSGNEEAMLALKRLDKE